MSDTQILLFCSYCKRFVCTIDMDIKELLIVNDKKIYPKDEEAQLSPETAASLA